MQIKKCGPGSFILGKCDLSRRLEQEGENFFFDAHINQCYEILNKDSIAIDAGANIGTHTVYMAKRCKKVIAFEPQKNVYFHLCGNLFLNGCLNVDAHNIPLYSTQTYMKMTNGTPAYDREHYSASEGFSPNASPEEGILATTIDKLNLNELTLIKIDTQGSDLAVMRGAVETIARTKPAIIFEIEPSLMRVHGDTQQDYFNFVDSIGYGYTRIDRHSDYLIRPK